MASDIPAENVTLAPVRKKLAGDFTLTADEQRAFKKWKRRHLLTRSPEKLIRYAAKEGKIAFIRHLLSQDHGRKTFLDAVYNSKQTIIQNFVEAGIDINMPDRDSDTPLINAALRGYTEIVDYLIKAGADLDIQGMGDSDDDGMGGDTALIWASRYGYMDIVKALIEAGANVHIQNRYGNTALIMAASKENCADIVTALLEAGADPDVRGNRGFTAREWARKNEHWDNDFALEKKKEKPAAPKRLTEKREPQCDEWEVVGNAGQEIVIHRSGDEQSGNSIRDIFDFNAGRLLTVVTSEGNRSPPVEKPFSEVDPGFLKQAEEKRKSLPLRLQELVSG